MNTIKLNNNEYVELDYVLLNAPIYSKGCRSSRDLIRKKNISVENYIYARNEKNEWIITYGKSIKYDKVLLLKSLTETIEELKNGENIKDEKGVMKAPEILNLNEEEKFKDLEGNVIDIEVRGERKVNNIYFKVKDIEKGFNILNLQISLIDIHNSYVEEIHYKYFLCEKKMPDLKIKNKPTNIKKLLYLTYEGLLRVLFVSKNNKTTPFIKWVVETLFTVHLNKDEVKTNTLISKIKGVSYAAIQELFNVNAKTVPCVYLTVLNNVKTLREKMNIDMKYNDEDYVYKYGLTNSFEQRKNGHKSEYKDIEDLIEFKLVQYAFIDPLNLSKAEQEISEVLKDNKINYKNHTEIVVLSEKELRNVKTTYSLISHMYSGHHNDLMQEVEKLRNEIKDLKQVQELEMVKLNCEKLLVEKELEMYKKFCSSKNIF